MAESYIVRKGGGGGLNLIGEEITATAVGTITAAQFVSLKPSLQSTISLILNSNTNIPVESLATEVESTSTTSKIVFIYMISTTVHFRVATFNYTNNTITLGTQGTIRTNAQNVADVNYGVKAVSYTPNRIAVLTHDNDSNRAARLYTYEVSSDTLIGRGSKTLANLTPTYNAGSHILVVNSTTILCSYRLSTNTLTKIVIQPFQANGEFAVSAEYNLNDSVISGLIGVSLLETNKVVFSVSTSVGGAGGTYVRIGTISGTTLTLGSFFLVISDSSGIYGEDFVHPVVLTSTKFAVFYRKVATLTTRYYLRVLRLSGTTIQAMGNELNTISQMGFGGEFFKRRNTILSRTDTQLKYFVKDSFNYYIVVVKYSSLSTDLTLKFSYVATDFNFSDSGSVYFGIVNNPLQNRFLVFERKQNGEYDIKPISKNTFIATSESVSNSVAKTGGTNGASVTVIVP
jgi:hypothetical protein